MSVRIIVDSASDLTKERADALNLDYMPLKTIFGETEYLDGVTISHKEFYEKLIECGTIPTTSQVSPHDFEAKFKEVKDQTQRSVYHWNRIADMAQYKPSPLNGFDLFNYMALIVCARARDYAEITFHKFADELEAKDAAGQYAFGAPENEKHRVTWEGIAVWTYLGATFKGLKNQGAVMTGSAYPGLWSLVYTPGDLESMAEAYTNVYINTCGPNRYEEFYKVVKNSKSDGIVLHLNRSCKLMGLLNNEGAEYVNAKLGVPYVSFDGDQTDPRVFTPAQYETRVQALTEMMDENQ